MDWQHILEIVVPVIGATWVLRSKLGDIELALRGHVAQDDERHSNLKERVLKLEDYRGRR